MTVPEVCGSCTIPALAPLPRMKASCVVFGMPKEAIALGGVDEVMSLTQIAQTLGRPD